MAKANNRKAVMNELMKHKDLIENKEIKNKINNKLKERQEKNMNKMQRKNKL